MKFVALVSGGKDSFFNVLHCMQNGHQLAALANLYPADTNQSEIDSFMFQTVGHDVIDFYSQCVDVPLFRQPITGTSSNVALEYLQTDDDEIEDLYLLLKKVKNADPEITGVSCGAILSHYQRTRVENVCERLGLTLLTYLWQRDQAELMQEMAAVVDARIVKVAAVGLTKKHLGLHIGQMLPILTKLNQMYDVHVCGEGGEFETLVLDAPFFVKRLKIVDREEVCLSGDVAYLKLTVEVEEKGEKGQTETNFAEEARETSLENTCEVPVPSLLLEEFQAIMDSVGDSEVENENVPQVSGAFSLRTRVSSGRTRFYISNLASTQSSVEAQTRDVLTQMGLLLTANGASFQDVQHMTVVVLDMANFAKVNGVYAHFFKHPLPPSRVCVESALPAGCLVQVSCIVLRPGLRQGIHIRSRSYWGPQNIGPYSQSIVEHRETFKTASLLGQIPLVPGSMELARSSHLLETVLSLQHLFRVKSLVGVRLLASCVCYVTEVSPILVENVWREYVSEIENGQDFYSRLTIVQVTGLPRGARVEWGGLAYEKVVDMYEDEDVSSHIPGLELTEKFATSIVSGEGFNMVQMYGNDVGEVVRFLRNPVLGDSYVSVMASLNNIHKLANMGLPAEFTPVSKVWDSEGQEFSFAITWMS